MLLACTYVANISAASAYIAHRLLERTYSRLHARALSSYAVSSYTYEFVYCTPHLFIVTICDFLVLRNCWSRANRRA